MTGNPFDDLESASTGSEEDEPMETDTEQRTERSTDTPDSTSGPAFEFSEVRQQPLYARDETWDEFEDVLGITIVPELRKSGIRDEEKREIHDAVLRLAAENPERVAELVEQERKV